MGCGDLGGLIRGRPGPSLAGRGASRATPLPATETPTEPINTTDADFGSKVVVGARITDVQEVFLCFFDLGDDFKTDGGQFDRLLHDGEVHEAGAVLGGRLHEGGDECIHVAVW